MYNAHCPEDRPDNAFYLKPLEKPRGDCWYTKSPIGHNTLARTINGLFESAGISGHFTNHSLRATAATRMFDAGVDEQLIMNRTGHSSTSGVRSYKRITHGLREMTSSVLNAPNPTDSVRVDSDIKPGADLPAIKSGADLPGANLKPGSSGINFAGASNFTVNFNY